MNTYFAFISYKREDEEWAIWLQHELEYYHLPALLNGRDDLPKSFRPVFRDIDELKAGNLPEQIHEALTSSLHLIVICSPRSAKSEWVNKEIETFIEIGKEKGIDHLERVFPFIVDGTPHAEDESQECFPKVLRDLPADKERIGGNVNESGRDKAFIKMMAGMLPNVSMDMLWNRYERDKAEEERKKREERDRLLIMQSRLVSKEAIDLAKYDTYLARLLALEALPKNLSIPDRPFIIEAESAFRTACFYNRTILSGPSSFTNSEQPGSINHVAFSSNGKLVATASDDDKLRIWNTEDGRLLKTLKTDKYTDAITFSPDGKHIAYGSTGFITISDLSTGEILTELFKTQRRKSPVHFISYSPDGKHIVSVQSEKSITIWDIDSDISRYSDTFRSLNGHTKCPNYAVFSPDGKRIVSAGEDGILIWDAENCILIKKIDGNDSDFAIFSSDGKRILALQHNFTEARIWDAESETLLNSIHLNEDIFSASFSPDGKLLVTIPEASNGKPQIWDTESGEALWTLNVEDGEKVFFGPDTKHIAFISGQYVQLLKLKDSAKQIIKINETPNRYNECTSAVFSPNGRYIVASKIKQTLVLNAENGEQIHALNGDNENLNASSFSPDGKRIVLNYINSITIWDIETGEASTIMNEVEGLYVNHTSFSPDGSKILSLTFIDNTHNAIKTWDIATGKILLDVKDSTDYLNYASYSPDGKRIVVAGNYYIDEFFPGGSSSDPDNGIIIVLDSATGKTIHTIKVAKGRVDFVTISPDNQQILSIANGFVTVWDMETGKDLYTLELIAFLTSASYSPDGKYIAAIDQEGTLIVCDALTGSFIQSISTDFRNSHSVRFHPDGRHIIATFDEGTIVVYDFPPLQELIDQTRERFKDRPLTPEERRMYYLE